MMSFAKFSLLLTRMIVFASCKGGIYFDPDFYVADSASQSIVSERGDIITAADIRFDQFACMNVEKVKELKRILMSKNIGSKNRARVFAEYAQLIEHFDRVNDRVKIKSIIEEL